MSIRKGRLTSTGVLAAPINFPTGSVLDFAGNTAPEGWLLCFGQAVSRTDFASLFATLGTTYGVGDGSTTFNLPDYRGRVLVGKDDMGGTAASRITSAGAGITGTTLGASGGSQTHTLTTAQLASHTHTQNSHNHTQNSHNHTQDPHRHQVTTSSGTAGSIYGIPDGTLNQTATNLDPDLFTNSVTATNNETTATNIATTATNQNNGSGTAHQNTQPSIIANKIIKV